MKIEGKVLISPHIQPAEKPYKHVDVLKYTTKFLEYPVNERTIEQYYVIGMACYTELMRSQMAETHGAETARNYNQALENGLTEERPLKQKDKDMPLYDEKTGRFVGGDKFTMPYDHLLRPFAGAYPQLMLPTILVQLESTSNSFRDSGPRPSQSTFSELRGRQQTFPRRYAALHAIAPDGDKDAFDYITLLYARHTAYDTMRTEIQLFVKGLKEKIEKNNYIPPSNILAETENTLNTIAYCERLLTYNREAGIAALSIAQRRGWNTNQLDLLSKVAFVERKFMSRNDFDELLKPLAGAALRGSWQEAYEMRDFIKDHFPAMYPKAADEKSDTGSQSIFQFSQSVQVKAGSVKIPPEYRRLFESEVSQSLPEVRKRLAARIIQQWIVETGKEYAIRNEITFAADNEISLDNPIKFPVTSPNRRGNYGIFFLTGIHPDDKLGLKLSYTVDDIEQRAIKDIKQQNIRCSMLLALLVEKKLLTSAIAKTLYTQEINSRPYHKDITNMKLSEILWEFLDGNFSAGVKREQPLYQNLEKFIKALDQEENTEE